MKRGGGGGGVTTRLTALQSVSRLSQKGGSLKSLEPWMSGYTYVHVEGATDFVTTGLGLVIMHLLVPVIRDAKLSRPNLKVLVHCMLGSSRWGPSAMQSLAVLRICVTSRGWLGSGGAIRGRTFQVGVGRFWKPVSRHHSCGAEKQTGDSCSQDSHSPGDGGRSESTANGCCRWVK
jgi:hypothetical protein